jgi:hypothetical protein
MTLLSLLASAALLMMLHRRLRKAACSPADDDAPRLERSPPPSPEEQWEQWRHEWPPEGTHPSKRVLAAANGALAVQIDERGNADSARFRKIHRLLAQCSSASELEPLGLSVITLLTAMARDEVKGLTVDQASWILDRYKELQRLHDEKKQTTAVEICNVTITHSFLAILEQ